YGKVWRAGNPEPAGWMVTATVANPPFGWPGVYAAHTALEYRFDYFAWSADGSTVPVPPQLDVGTTGRTTAQLSVPDHGQVEARWLVWPRSGTSDAPAFDSGWSTAALVGVVATGLVANTEYVANAVLRFPSGAEMWTEAFVFTTAENNPPDTPTGSVGEVTETTAQLLSSPFSDPDGDAHAASQWRIYRVDDGTLVLDSGETTTDLTSFLATGLAPETAYEFDVRHKDDSGDAETEWSEWSVRVVFDTAAIGGWRPCLPLPATEWELCDVVGVPEPDIRERLPEFATPTHEVVGASIFRRPDAISLDYLTAHTLGPIAVADTSKGLVARIWKAWTPD